MGTINQHMYQQELLVRKNAIEAIEALTKFGLKRLNANEMFYTYAKMELKYIDELGLVNDLLEIKRFVDGVRLRFNVNVIESQGDFRSSCVWVALGISRIRDINALTIPEKTWGELLEQKVLSMYYPKDVMDEILEWAKHEEFDFSVHLGQPIIKFSNIFVLIKCTDM
ncbi:hypothetical protein E5358_03335 [Palleniella muris]|uniref:Uncharacterized protein n=1 Tax=Palleniella muris TaxID=3038145 RepID=A0AC61QS75_9BACT|nr:hypothetical protein [Palleniella muris]TGX83303.1 hypothetical protein E5358_03335 [Palleniella muris]